MGKICPTKIMGKIWHINWSKFGKNMVHKLVQFCPSKFHGHECSKKCDKYCAWIGPVFPIKSTLKCFRIMNYDKCKIYSKITTK